MIVGVLKEIKKQEFRVCMTPAGVQEFVKHGHQVLVEKTAGTESGFSDEQYQKAGATLIDTPKEIFDRSEMLMHVKELQPSEYDLIKSDQIVFTYLHLAAEHQLTQALIKSNCIAIAYETVQKEDHSLPLLAPMSEVAGKLSVQEAAKYLEKHYGGLGVLLGGVPGVNPTQVIVLGAGVAGLNAALVAAGMGARVALFDTNIDRLRFLQPMLPSNVVTIYSTSALLQEHLKNADVVIGAVLVTGDRAPKLVLKEDLKLMKKGSILVDIAIDQGGCFETSRVTTHQDPVFEVDGILHYCVGNMPGAVARTSTLALTNATLKYALNLASKGWKKACQDDLALRKGLNVIHQKITHQGVAHALGLEYHPTDSFLN